MLSQGNTNSQENQLSTTTSTLSNPSSNNNGSNNNITTFTQEGSKVAISGLTALNAYFDLKKQEEANRGALIKAKADAVQNLLKTISDLADQTKEVVKQQTIVFKDSTDKFMDLIKLQAKEVEKVEETREKRLKIFANAIITAETLLDKNPESEASQKRYDKALETYDKKETEVDKSLEKQRNDLLENIKNSKNEFRILTTSFKFSDAMVLKQAMSLQDNMQYCLDHLLDINKDLKPKPLAQSNVQIEEVTEEEDKKEKSSIKALTSTNSASMFSSSNSANDASIPNPANSLGMGKK